MFRVSDAIVGKNHQVQFLLFFIGGLSIAFHLLDFHYLVLVDGILFIADILDGDPLEVDLAQLTTITLGDTRMELTYDGKLIETMKSYSDNELEATYTFEHGDKNRITGYKVEYNNTAKSNVAKNACLIESAFRFLIPEIATSEAKEYVKTATDQRKDNRNYSVTMTYDGKNVASKTITYSNGSTECTYAYTEYKNPFYGLLSDENNNATSKNAVSQMVVKNPLLPVYANSPDYTYTYTYKTDGKVPTQVIEQLEWTLTVGTTTTSHNEKIQTDYEFVD